MLTILIFALFLLASYTIQAAGVYAGVRLVRAPRATFPRALLAMLILILTSIAFNIVLAYIPYPDSFALAGALLALFTTLFLNIVTLAVLFRITLKRAALAWLPLLGGYAVSLVLAFFVVRPFLVEAYRMPTTVMIPTLNNEHYLATCPKCGGTLIVPFMKSWSSYRVYPEYGICKDCGKSSPIDFSKISHTIYPDDRLMVAKFLTPQRWDIILYHYSPLDIYADRIIALPGETVYIDSGKIFVNGAPLTPPPDLAKSELKLPPSLGPSSGGSSDRLYGLMDNPTKLGSDEFFVIGDNTEHSRDSRLFGPIKRDKIVGVATVIYWPLSRFRILR